MQKFLILFSCFTLSISINFKALIKNDIQPIQPAGCCDFNVNYTFQANKTLVYILEFNQTENHTLPTSARVTTESNDATEKYPLLVAVWQQKEVISWQVPRLGGSQTKLEYKKISRTLCPEYVNINKTNDVTLDSFFITISSDSPTNISFSILVVHIEDFSVGVNMPISFSVSPAESKFYSFRFPDYLSSAVLRIESNSSVCMSLSVQNFSCPVYDQEDNLKYRGYWETITTKGGMLLTKDAFPQRLFLVFVVHSNDEDCTGKPGAILDRNKPVTFEVIPSLTYEEYLVAMVAVVIAFALMYIGAFAAVVVTYRRKHQYYSTEEDYDSSCGETPISEASKSILGNDQGIDGEQYDPERPSSSSNVVANTYDIQRTIKLCLNDMAQNDFGILRRRSNLYFWNLVTIAIFYSLPVVQLVLTYQKVLNQTGNQDLCYYNFLCSHRLGIISDFNHIYSNIGYVLLGILFLLIVYRRERSEPKRSTGIPQLYGLYYTLGAALLMEGVLSGGYHVCPNHSNFQFDTSFMYTLATITMLKIYQSRHPDINASAYTAFGVLAVIIALGMCGVLYITKEFYIAFTVLHVCICLYMTAQIYYMGDWNLGMGGPRRVHQFVMANFRSNPRTWCRPQYPSRMILLILGNVCNWALIGFGLFQHLGDFATYLLAILLCNLMIYFVFYIMMKLIVGEKILLQGQIYIALATVSCIGACYFFYHKTISWKLTPAQSRTYNQPCLLFDFYDNHDVWHFLSAVSLFFSFMVILTLDDDLIDVDRRKIAVF